ncbi:glutamyl-tRNA reductase [Kribbia dieselivorans]|uniref:glutamyl-tRNA reductase n=1 Tax=Kribbia dieselivorans TaxID=331526 RepID=UPI0008399CE7|nr:glutamyl-tRNA reductase [Kribbia dieselivorans]
MSLLVLGLSHHLAPIDLLERVSLDRAARDALAHTIDAGEHVSELVVVSTCNRTEVYAEASTFHGAVDELTDALTQVTHLGREDLRDHLYLHYDDRAVLHAFSVAAGLDSMAVGESQILGQLRDSLAEGQERGDVGPVLNALVQNALRVGKRVHTETGIDSVSRSLVQTGLDHAARHLGGLRQARVLVIGAGGMSALSAMTAMRNGVASLTIINRTFERAANLATRLEATARPIEDLSEALAEADIVISCTGSSREVIGLEAASAAQVARGGARQTYIDLALPQDIAREVGGLAGVSRVGLAELGNELSGAERHPEVAQAASLVADEVENFRVTRAADQVGPTIKALRTAANGLLEAELARLEQRTPNLTDNERAEVRLAMHRTVEKLLHSPTVKVKEMAADGRLGHYADAINVLFDLQEGRR